LLINSALRRYLRAHAAGIGRLDPADIEDLAAEKSLELMIAAESGKWRVAGRRGGEIAAYLSQAARNGLVDLIRERSRSPVLGGENGVTMETDAGSCGPCLGGRPDGPEMLMARQEFALALSDCADTLQPRSLLVWFLRVFHDMPSKEIACHPEVRLKPGHVDVLLQRSREAIAACMREKGHEPADMPPGTFVELWKRFRRLAPDRELMGQS
jgi:RNA polymerase sigma factor (sigma-70 family)